MNTYSGLDICENYFLNHGQLMIADKFPSYAHRIAAGLVGAGSECYGFDDEISRDHDWGPGFCLWLSENDRATIGTALVQAYDELPKTFLGFTRSSSKWGTHRTGVFEIGEFYTHFIGLPNAPTTLEEWLSIPETYLSEATNGRIFEDALGIFTLIRKKLLDFYPEDIRLVKIAARCMSAAQSGQYNFARSIRRGETYAAQYAETLFCHDAMSILFLLYRRYAPYYKWRHRAVRELSPRGEFLHHKISELMGSRVPAKKITLIEEISAMLIQELQRQALTDSRSDFLLDHGPIVHEKIQDPKLKGRDVWLG